MINYKPKYGDMEMWLILAAMSHDFEHDFDLLNKMKVNPDGTYPVKFEVGGVELDFSKVAERIDKEINEMVKKAANGDECWCVLQEDWRKHEIKNYLKGNIKINESLLELDYCTNKKFIDEVTEEYKNNLNCVKNNYSREDAKEDAIKTVINRWEGEIK